MQLSVRRQAPARNSYLILPDQLQFLGAAFLDADQLVVSMFHGADEFIQLDLDGSCIAGSSYEDNALPNQRLTPSRLYSPVTPSQPLTGRLPPPVPCLRS